MDVFGPLLVLAAAIWTVIHLSKSTKWGSNWIAFALAWAVGILVSGSAITQWVGSTPGDFVPYVAAATSIVAIVLGGWDVAKDRKPDGRALASALSLPMLVALSWPLLRSTTTGMFQSGWDTMISGV